MMAHAASAAFPRPFRSVSRAARTLPWRVTMERAEAESEDWNLALARVAAQDRDSFRLLFCHFAPRIKSYLLRLGAPPQLAEELAQEAMLVLWRKAPLFDPAKASAATWLFTIARNLRIDALRKERRPQFDPDDPALLPDAERGAEEGMALSESEDAVRAALKALPPDQARIVELSFFADKPHSQIAAELAIPLGTVKSRLRLAMGRLRAAMGERP
jgi:RNA polymerase sigma factor (sigma-70 family)